MFFKTGFLKNFGQNFTGRQLCWSFFLIKLQAFTPATLLKRDSNRYFPVKFRKFLRTPFSTEHLCWVLLPFHTTGLFLYTLKISDRETWHEIG